MNFILVFLVLLKNKLITFSACYKTWCLLYFFLIFFSLLQLQLHGLLLSWYSSPAFFTFNEFSHVVLNGTYLSSISGQGLPLASDNAKYRCKISFWFLSFYFNSSSLLIVKKFMMFLSSLFSTHTYLLVFHKMNFTIHFIFSSFLGIILWLLSPAICSHVSVWCFITIFSPHALPLGV